MRLLILLLPACAATVTFKDQQYSVSKDDANRFTSLMTDYRAKDQDLATRSQGMAALCARSAEIEDASLKQAFEADCQARAGATATAISQRDQAIAEKKRQEDEARAEEERKKQEREAQLAEIRATILVRNFKLAAEQITAHTAPELQGELDAAKKAAAAEALSKCETALENGDFVKVDTEIARAAELGFPAEAELLDRVRVAKTADCTQLKAKALTAQLSLAASRAWIDRISQVHSNECDANFDKAKKKIIAAAAMRAGKANRAKKYDVFDQEIALMKAAGAVAEAERLEAKRR